MSLKKFHGSAEEYSPKEIVMKEIEVDGKMVFVKVRVFDPPYAQTKEPDYG